MYCIKCGTEIKPGQKFCTNCGTPAPSSPNQRESDQQETGQDRGASQTTTDQKEDAKNVESYDAHTIVDTLNQYVGGSKEHVSLNWKVLFKTCLNLTAQRKLRKYLHVVLPPPLPTLKT